MCGTGDPAAYYGCFEHVRLEWRVKADRVLSADVLIAH